MSKCSVYILSILLLIVATILPDTKLCIAQDVDSPYAWRMTGYDQQRTGQSSTIGAQTSDLLWMHTYELDTDFCQPISSPVSDADGTIYSSECDGLSAVNADGTLKWRFVRSGITNASAPAITTDGQIIVHDQSSIYSLDSSGNINWEYPIEEGFVGSDITIGADDNIYASSYESVVYALNPGGAIRWIRDLGGNEDIFSCNPAITIGHDGTLYTGSKDGHLYALNPADGSDIWRSAAELSLRCSHPIISLDGILRPVQVI